MILTVEANSFCIDIVHPVLILGTNFISACDTCGERLFHCVFAFINMRIHTAKRLHKINVTYVDLHSHISWMEG